MFTSTIATRTLKHLKLDDGILTTTCEISLIFAIWIEKKWPNWVLAQIPTTFIHTLLNLDHLPVGLHKYDPGLWLSKDPAESTLLKNKGLVFTSVLGIIRHYYPLSLEGVRWGCWLTGMGHKFRGLEPKEKHIFICRSPSPHSTGLVCSLGIFQSTSDFSMSQQLTAVFARLVQSSNPRSWIGLPLTPPLPMASASSLPCRLGWSGFTLTDLQPGLARKGRWCQGVRLDEKNMS